MILFNFLIPFHTKSLKDMNQELLEDVHDFLSILCDQDDLYNFFQSLIIHKRIIKVKSSPIAQKLKVDIKPEVKQILRQ
jgi:hypothetical protein